MPGLDYQPFYKDRRYLVESRVFSQHFFHDYRYIQIHLLPCYIACYSGIYRRVFHADFSHHNLYLLILNEFILKSDSFITLSKRQTFLKSPKRYDFISLQFSEFHLSLQIFHCCCRKNGALFGHHFRHRTG